MARNKQKKRGLAPPPARKPDAQEEEEEEDVMETDGGEAGKRCKAAGAAEGGATAGRAAAARREGKDNLQFEDPFEDEYESEEEIYEEDSEEEEEDMEVDGGAAAAASAAPGAAAGKKARAAAVAGKKKTGADAMMEEDEEEEAHVETKVWRPGVDELAEGEELEYDPSAYVMYHCLAPEWPCLSFDILADPLGGGRTRFPVTMYAACGTQADQAGRNKLTVMKLSEMRKTYRKSALGKDEDSDDDDDDDEEDEDDEGVDMDPLLEQRSVDHRGGVNRVRAMPQASSVVATWADTGHVHIWDVSSLVKAIDQPTAGTPLATKPVFSFGGHREEGFAMDWSRVQAGRLATGDNAGAIHIWQGGEGGAGAAWEVLDQKQPYKGHASSVEDLQWSPTEASVFLSCSADGSARVWDVRQRQGAMLSVQAHDADVNVCSWNRNVAYLVATGSDDGSFKVWDLRQFGAAAAATKPIAHFTWHKGPITSIEWHPQDESILACASEDDTVTIWDLSVEEDEEVAAQRAADAAIAHLPPQLLFVHQGQREVKELHFHPQVPGLLMTTAMDGFNIFKPAIGL